MLSIAIIMECLNSILQRPASKIEDEEKLSTYNTTPCLKIMLLMDQFHPLIKQENHDAEVLIGIFLIRRLAWNCTHWPITADSLKVMKIETL